MNTATKGQLILKCIFGILNFLKNERKNSSLQKFMFSKKATKIDKIFTVDLTLCQIDGEDFVNFCGLLRKHELYYDT